MFREERDARTGREKVRIKCKRNGCETYKGVVYDRSHENVMAKSAWTCCSGPDAVENETSVIHEISYGHQETRTTKGEETQKQRQGRGQREKSSATKAGNEQRQFFSARIHTERSSRVYGVTDLG